MDVYFDHFKVDPDYIEKYGAFNVSLVSDLPLFIDPFLLFNSKKVKYRELHNRWLTKHCRNTLVQWREFLGPGFSEYVFPSPRIPSMHVSDYKKAWQKAAREAGIPDRRIYDLRASFASRANACHASGLTIAQLLGHTTNTQILHTYVKPLDENTRAVIDALDTARTLQSHIPPSVH